MPFLFAATLFLSAVLLFVMQPLLGRMLLPRLGGAPAVWSTCMVYFQAVLLAGYAYAHLSTTRLAIRRQALVHLALLMLGAAALPVAIPDDWAPPQQGSPVAGLLVLLLLSSGLPFFLISTTSPVLQKWLANSRARGAGDPYFLFAASNLGSLVALLGYPVLVEPYFPLRTQVWLWTGGYLLLTLLCAACALALVRPSESSAPSSKKEGAPSREALRGQAPGPWLWLRWLALAFAPSALLVAVTTYLTTDIAPIPLLWVLPLALYLLTFILAFARLPPLLHRGVALALPLVCAVLIFLFLIGIIASPATIAFHLLALFMAGLACHGELARLSRRAGSPPPARSLPD